MNLNEAFCKDAKLIHISHSNSPVAGHYMITNSSSTKRGTLCGIWGCHRNAADDSVLLGCDAVLLARCSEHSWTALPWI